MIFENDEEAWWFLRSRGFTHKQFCIYRTKPLNEITKEEFDAIDYLADEWDWVYDLSDGEVTNGKS